MIERHCECFEQQVQVSAPDCTRDDRQQNGRLGPPRTQFLSCRCDLTGKVIDGVSDPVNHPARNSSRSKRVGIERRRHPDPVHARHQCRPVRGDRSRLPVAVADQLRASGRSDSAVLIGPIVNDRHDRSPVIRRSNRQVTRRHTEVHQSVREAAHDRPRRNVHADHGCARLPQGSEVESRCGAVAVVGEESTNPKNDRTTRCECCHLNPLQIRGRGGVGPSSRSNR